MAEAKKGQGGEGSEPMATAIKPPRNASECRRYMRQRLVEKFPAIVDGFLTNAQQGSSAHVKMAAELLAERDERGSPAKGSAARLLEQMRRIQKDEQRADASKG